MSPAERNRFSGWSLGIVGSVIAGIILMGAAYVFGWPQAINANHEANRLTAQQVKDVTERITSMESRYKDDIHALRDQREEDRKLLLDIYRELKTK